MKPLLLLLALCGALPATAIERVRLRATSVSAAGMQLADLTATLDIQSDTQSTIAVTAARALLPKTLEAQTGALTALTLRCTNPLILEPRFECPAFTLQARSTRWPALSLSGKASFRSDTGALNASGGGMQLAGAPLRFTLARDGRGMQATASLAGLQLPQLQALLIAQKLPLPTDMGIEGRADAELRLQLRGTDTTAQIRLSVTEGGFQNADYTAIGEKLAFRVEASANLTGTPLTFEATVAGDKGQALAGPVLLDLDKNPLQLQAAGQFGAGELLLTSLRSDQRDLALVTGTAAVQLSPLLVKQASLQAGSVRFPAAYATYMQLALATTPFNQLTTSGNASLRVEVRDNLPTQLELAVTDLAFSDPSRQLKVEGVNSALHWTAALTGPPRPSWLEWESSQGWGIVGARTRLDFIVQDRDFRLVQPARLPFFDGALRINALSAENIGTDELSGVFDAVIEPISVGPIAKAFGLPEFAGQLSGRIPGLTYKDQLLSLQGNFEAEMFDGRVVASNLRVREPLGAWPRLYADIVARNLDLDLITNTFEVGSITGRLDVELLGLETFNWTPVAFDLRMATPKGDRSRHRISQRAVESLSDIGGGGGGVAAALQTGALKFFDDFAYDRIGLSCRLRNDVCEMAGVEPAKVGFYIVKGRGLPRIDIIGNNQRVDWPQLMTQVRDAMSNPEGIQLK